MNGKQFSMKHIFRHDLIWNLKKNMGLVIIGIMAFLILIPFGTAGIPGDSIFEVATTHDQMKFRLIHPDFVLPVYAVTVLFGAINGIRTFFFLLEKKQTTVYFSFGLNRKKLFASRYLTGSFGIAAAILIPMLVSLCLNQIALGGYPDMTKCFLFVCCGLILAGMVSYTLSILACSLAGTLSEAVLYNLFLLTGMSGVVYCVNQLFLHLVWGNPYGAMSYSGTSEICKNLFYLTERINPAAFFFEDCSTYSMFYRGLKNDVAATFSVHILLAWGCGLILLILLAMFAFQRRRAEQAELEGVCSWMTQIVLFTGMFCLFVLVFDLLEANSRILAFLLAMTAAGFFYFLLRLYFIHSSKKLWQRWFPAFLQMGLVLLVFLGCGWIGNLAAADLPEDDQIASAAMSYVGAPSYISQETAGSSNGSSYYMVSNYTYQQTDAIRQILSLHRELIEMGMQKMQTDETEFAQTVVPYDIQISYTLKNGKEKYYYYDRATFALLEEMLALDQSEEVKEGIKQVVTGTVETGDSINWSSQAFASGSIYLSDIWYSNPCQLNMTDSARAEFLQALEEDILAQSVEERYFPEQEAIGVILFSSDGEADCQSFAYHLGNAVIYLTEQFQHTLAFLGKNDLNSYISFSGEIESITLQWYDPYDGLNGRTYPASNFFLGYKTDTLDDFLVQTDYGDKKAITDPQKIQALLPKLRSFYFTTKEGYLAAIKLKDSDAYIYKYLPGTQKEILSILTGNEAK